MDSRKTDPTTRPTAVMARLARPRADRTTKIALVADTHVSESNRSYFEAAIEDINARNVDVVVHAGDLSFDGAPAEFDLFDELIGSLDPPWIAVPGNHDVPKESDDHPALPFRTFEDRYANDEGYPFVERIGELDLIAANSAGTDDVGTETSDGAIDDDQLEALDSMLSEATTPIVVVHHNLPAMMDQYVRAREAVYPEYDGGPPVFRSPGPFVDLLQTHAVPLVLTGHMHYPSVADQGGVREVTAPSLIRFLQGYVLVEIGPEGTTARLVVVADHDELLHGCRDRRRMSKLSEVLTDMTTANLALFPLVDESNCNE